VRTAFNAETPRGKGHAPGARAEKGEEYWLALPWRSHSTWCSTNGRTGAIPVSRIVARSNAGRLRAQPRESFDSESRGKPRRHAAAAPSQSRVEVKDDTPKAPLARHCSRPTAAAGANPRGMPRIRSPAALLAQRTPASSPSPSDCLPPPPERPVPAPRRSRGAPGAGRG